MPQSGTCHVGSKTAVVTLWVKLQYLQSVPQLCFIGSEVVVGACRRKHFKLPNLDF